MISENVIATFDNEADADNAVAQLESAGIPRHAIEIHSKNSGYGRETSAAYSTTDEPKKSSFWSWLTGEEHTESSANSSHYDHYDKEIEAGSIIVSVITEQSDVEKVTEILNSRSVSMKVEEMPVAVDSAPTEPVDTVPPTPATAEPVAYVENSTKVAEEVIPLHEEKLVVGKTEVESGRMRVQRYTTQRPVEAQVALRQEHITVHRRPVVDKIKADAGSFEDTHIELVATDEEAVVGKTAHVVEEVVVAKHSGERVETVTDTVRKEEVKVDDTDLKPTVAR
jgi:uncharacterized protein (TIGR02271 family)